MDILVTGGGGFVLSNLVRHLLESDSSATAIIVDIAPFDDLLAQLFESVGDRLRYVQGDARDREMLRDVSSARTITHVVDGATVTQADDPRRFIEVNVTATTELVDWARTLEGLERYLYISSIAVYGEPTESAPTGPQSEEGPFGFGDLYAVSKYASEEICRLYGEMFHLDVCRARLGRVFGPMERVTPGRNLMSMPYHIMRSVVETRPLRAHAEALREVGSDFIGSEEVASALSVLLRAPALAHDVYNVASGSFTQVSDLLAAFGQALPGFEFEVVERREDADIVSEQIQMRRRARGGAFAIERLAELGWRSRALSEQVASYVDWVLVDGEARCPKLPR